MRVKNEEGFLQINKLTGIPPTPPPFGKKSKTLGEQASALRPQEYRPLPRTCAPVFHPRPPEHKEGEHRFVPGDQRLEMKS